MRKYFSLLLSLALLLSVGLVATAEETPVSVTLVMAGARGDRSFYDSANSGLEQLMADYGVIGNVIECREDPSRYEESLIAAADTSDFVVAVGWQFWDYLVEVAPQLPDAKFIFLDNDLGDVENIFSITYAENQGSFLVGYIAAKLSQTGIIGAVGGADNTTINNFIVGYKQGAAHANPDIQVEVSYTEDYEDPAKGKEHALALYDKGVDVIFQIAGKTGEGVFEAAAAGENRYAIGVDSDQKYINPEVIVCSMIKEVGKSIYGTVESYIQDGTFAGGTIWNADMSSGYISVGYGDESMTQQVSAELKQEVEALAAQIMAGEIAVDSTR